MLKKVYIIMSIIAAITTIIIGILKRLEPDIIIIRIIIVISVCIFIGLLAKVYLTIAVFKNKKNINKKDDISFVDEDEDHKDEEYKDEDNNEI